MANKIYKYELNELPYRTKLELPKTHKILCVQYQNNQLYLWAIVDDSSPQKQIEIIVYGTGHEIDDVINLSYITTIQEPPYVWHLFKKEIL